MSTTWVNAQRWVLLQLGAWAEARRGRSEIPDHLIVGERGEQEALFELRRRGYQVVARRWQTPKLRGDLDLVAWDGDWLCFVEVKTRSERDPMSPAETAVDDEKRRILRRTARAYLRAFPEGKRREIPVRFDIVAVYLTDPRPEFEVFQGAFGWADRETNRRS
jgi:putative endonuclease